MLLHMQVPPDRLMKKTPMEVTLDACGEAMSERRLPDCKSCYSLAVTGHIPLSIGTMCFFPVDYDATCSTAWYALPIANTPTTSRCFPCTM